jgi:hypothetical protein
MTMSDAMLSSRAVPMTPLRHGILVIVLTLAVSRGHAQDVEPAVPVDAPGPAETVSTEAPVSREPLWFQASYFSGWIKGSAATPPLVTTGTLNPAAPTIPGILGMPGTQVVMGGDGINTGMHPGGRFEGGAWLFPNAGIGVEAGYLFLTATDSQQVAGTTGRPGSPNLAVPYFDVAAAGTLAGTPGETIFILPGPLAAGGNVFPGFAGVFTRTLTNSLQTADVNGILNLLQGEHLHLDAVAGFRWMQLSEDFVFTARTIELPGAPFGAAGSFYNAFDAFGARDIFLGGQLGVRAGFDWKRWTLQASSKVALGDVQQVLNVTGVSQTTSGNLFFSNPAITRLPFAGGVFAQPGNIGHHERDRFGAIFDETLNVGFRASRHVTLMAGYNFLLASSVARPVDSLDRSINATETGLASAVRAAGTPLPVAGPPAPLFSFHDSWLWAQGVSAGVELRY